MFWLSLTARRRPSTPAAPSAPRIVVATCRSRAAPWSPSRGRRPAPPDPTASARRDRASSCASRLRASSSVSCALRASSGGRTSLAWTSSSRLPQVEPRRQQVEVVLRLACGAGRLRLARSRAAPRAASSAAPRPSAPGPTGRRTRPDRPSSRGAPDGTSVRIRSAPPVGGTTACSALAAVISPVVTRSALTVPRATRRGRHAHVARGQDTARGRRTPKAAAPRSRPSPPMPQQSAQRVMARPPRAARARPARPAAGPRRSPTCRARAAPRGRLRRSKPRPLRARNLGRRAGRRRPPPRGLAVGGNRARVGTSRACGSRSQRILIAAVMPGRRPGSGVTQVELDVEEPRRRPARSNSTLASALNAVMRVRRSSRVPTACTSTSASSPVRAAAIRLVDLAEHVERSRARAPARCTLRPRRDRRAAIRAARTGRRPASSCRAR